MRRHISIKQCISVKGIFLLTMVLSIIAALVFSGCTLQTRSKGTDGSKPALSQKPLSARDFQEQGKTAFNKGQFESAITNWVQAEKIFENNKNTAGQCMVMVELSRAYEATGQSSKALEILEKALSLAESSENQFYLASVLNQLGNLHTVLGDTELAETYLSRSLSIAGEIDDPVLTASILNHQGNLYLVRKNFPAAVQTYASSAAHSKTGGTYLLTGTAQTNQARACLENNDVIGVQTLLKEAVNNFHRLKDSRSKALGLIQAGLAWQALENLLPDPDNEMLRRCHTLFTQASQIAQKLGDHRTASYAFGYTGRLYEDAHQYADALTMTRKAVLSAQQVYAPESLYRWQWQTGRILKQMDNTSKAIDAYRRAIFTLESIRFEIDNCHDIQQAAFRKIVGSVCFELVDLLLGQSRSMKDQQERESLLLEAREVVELLRVYELREYFKDDCVDAGSFQQVNLEDISKNTVVIYPIMLENRMELLVSFPSGMQQFTVHERQETVTREIREFRRKLEKLTTWEFLPHARKLYDYLIRPLEKKLSTFPPDTLVFVPPGPLRTVPMAALHDGSRFLVQKYASAVTVGLNLVDPTPIKREDLKILAAGITRASQGFPPLPEVASELQNISRLFSSKLLLDQEFLISNMEQDLKKDEFNILHIASHGQFQGDADRTFILAFDEKLTMDTLDKYAGFLQFRNTPLDLLALSACESAAGDDLAALGMAGVAVKAGARSALATLWFINDMASSLMIKQFYLQIKDPSVSRAAALQHAQLRLLEDSRYEHPGYWSPFLLINNWL